MTVSWLPYERACLTPLGPATCLGLDNDGQAQEWITIIDTTGEQWNWHPMHIRFAPTVTDGRPEPSPFTEIAPKLQRQIDRYKANGWL